MNIPDKYLPKRVYPKTLTHPFIFACAFLEHSHIHGMASSLIEAGGVVKWVYDPNPKQLQSFLSLFPSAKVARTYKEILEDDEVELVAAAAVTNERALYGMQALEAGKHYFTDKAPLTTLAQLEAVRETVLKTGKRYQVYYGEHINNEAAIHAEKLVVQGAIGRLVQFSGMGPHLFRPERNPSWFYNKEKAGGILIDICSHQIEQFLAFSGATTAEVTSSHTANLKHPEWPEFEDYGDIQLLGNGVVGNLRVDWYTPAGLPVWGDGRVFLLGTEGYIELRKYINVAESSERALVYLVNGEGSFKIQTDKKIGFPYYAQLIEDCRNGSDLAMPQERIFMAAELAIRAQASAKRLV